MEDAAERLFSVVGAPALIIGLLIVSVDGKFDFDWFRFQLTQAHYRNQVAQLAVPSPKFDSWSWGSTGGGIGSGEYHALVYDATDQPLGRPLIATGPGATYSARSYGDHFYLVTELLQ
jgi:hypothetical protein